MNRTVAKRGKWRKPIFFGNDEQGYFLLPPEAGKHRKIKGRLRQEGESIAVFIQHPPRNGRYEHEKCLQSIGDGWFRLHFEYPPTTVEAAVVFTEDFLYRCWRGY